jgi:hypothetical protein
MPHAASYVMPSTPHTGTYAPAPHWHGSPEVESALLVPVAVVAEVLALVLAVLALLVVSAHGHSPLHAMSTGTQFAPQVAS